MLGAKEVPWSVLDRGMVVGGKRRYFGGDERV